MKNTKETDHIENIMNKAYDQWQNNRDWTQEEFWNNLSHTEKIAVGFGNMNYQVGNGGFVQWYDNGYYDVQIEFLLAILDACYSEEYPTLSNIRFITREVHNFICDYSKNLPFEDVDDQDYEEEHYNELQDKLDSLDDRYYALDEDKMFEEVYKLIQRSEK